MYNFHFIVNPRDKLIFNNQKAQMQIRNITSQHLAFKIRTTNNKDFKVVGNMGILNPKTTNIIQIISNHEIIAKAKFQIMTVIINPNDDINLAFSRANSEQTQTHTLKTRATFDDETKSIISNTSYVQSSVVPQQLQQISINQVHTPPNEIQKEIFQPTIFHLIFVGISCLLIGYWTHMFQTFQKPCS